MTSPAALGEAERAPVTVVIGASDSGKTTLVVRLANHLLARGFRVAVVDADIGQSELGPPTTIGLGHLDRPLSRLADAEVRALVFVGAFSPALAFRAVVAGTRALVERARRDHDRVVVDTSGLVAGRLGRALKHAKLDAVAPDLVVCLQRADECEHILERYRAETTPRLLRLPVSPAARRRTARDRLTHRRSVLERYFERSRPVVVPLARVALGPGAAGGGPVDLHDTLVGVEDAEGRLLALGRVTGVDLETGTLTIETPASPAQVVTVRPGRARYPR